MKTQKDCLKSRIDYNIEMNMIRTSIIFLLLFCPLFYQKTHASSSSQATEHYLRIADALRDITPDNIVKIIMVYSYQPYSGNFQHYLTPITSNSHDLTFYKNVFPYVKNTLILTDQDKLSDEGTTQKIKSYLSTLDAKIILLMYSGHGGIKGNLCLGQYKPECMELQREFDKAMKSPAVINTPDEARKTTSKFNENWLVKKCNDNLLFPDYLFGRDIFSADQKVVFINNSCNAGTYKNFLDSPQRSSALFALVYGADEGEKAFSKNNSTMTKDGLIEVGGEMILKLKQRLLPQYGCNLDGSSDYQVTNKRDLVLNFSEWTYQMHETTYHKITDITKPKEKVITTNLGVAFSYDLDDRVIGLPVQVYTKDQCVSHQPVDTREWANIKDQIGNHTKQINHLASTDLNAIFDMQTKLSKGEY